uniref:Uncharacterized protein n=1 Tax=Chromera velia CCMP2878 TaxID=1169474 RepID=A0A0G4IBM8_9ALVE|eukprot:Cvel_12797.t1-p1 / transcript=Cvel_12797.t1 / gene=Cvel_12797 / organism=Chromera_velia_CCMP2878 / gene_product=hypothetical protein / transcript_product=hypothetical protein / location=Cvel_scaffold852:15698-19427(+) / protein_length=489 / sequence_SO=supercontig / SO=protein_coding / is_pseudo=false
MSSFLIALCVFCALLYPAVGRLGKFRLSASLPVKEITEALIENLDLKKFKGIEDIEEIYTSKHYDLSTFVFGSLRIPLARGPENLAREDVGADQLEFLRDIKWKDYDAPQQSEDAQWRIDADQGLWITKMYFGSDRWHLDALFALSRGAMLEGQPALSSASNENIVEFKQAYLPLNPTVIVKPILWARGKAKGSGEFAMMVYPNPVATNALLANFVVPDYEVAKIRDEKTDNEVEVFDVKPPMNDESGRKKFLHWLDSTVGFSLDSFFHWKSLKEALSNALQWLHNTKLVNYSALITAYRLSRPAELPSPRKTEEVVGMFMPQCLLGPEETDPTGLTVSRRLVCMTIVNWHGDWRASRTAKISNFFNSKKYECYSLDFRNMLSCLRFYGQEDRLSGKFREQQMTFSPLKEASEISCLKFLTDTSDFGENEKGFRSGPWETACSDPFQRMPPKCEFRPEDDKEFDKLKLKFAQPSWTCLHEEGFGQEWEP